MDVFLVGVTLSIIAVVIGAVLFKGVSPTYALVFGNVALFVFHVLYWPGVASGNNMYPIVKDLGVQGIDLFDPPRMYTLLTSMFVHSGVFHLVFNIIVLVLFGSQFEDKVGRRAFLGLYLVSGVLAAYISTFFNLAVPWESYHSAMNTYGVGASAAIFGVLGAYAALFPHDEVYLPMVIIIRRMEVGFGVFVILLVQTALAVTFFASNIGFFAHIGGVIGGWFIAKAVKERVYERLPGRVRMQMNLGSVDRPKMDVDVTIKERFADNDKAMKLLDHIDTEDEFEVREMWVEKFTEEIPCPSCTGELKNDGMKVSCGACGFKGRFG